MHNNAFRQRITSKNLDYVHLLHYAKQGTLNDRVTDNYQNFRFIAADSSSDNSYKFTALYKKVLDKITNMNMRAIDTLK